MESSNLPPLHPGLVHFPIALVTVSFFADLIGRLFGNASLRTTGWWTLVAGAVTSVLTVILGYYDMNRAALTEPTHDYVDLHLKIGWILMISILGLSMWRAHFQSHFERPITAGYFLAALMATALILFQGWFGGEIVYTQGAGVAATGQGTESLEEAEKSLSTVRKILGKVPGFDHRTASEHHEPTTEPAGAGKP